MFSTKIYPPPSLTPTVKLNVFLVILKNVSRPILIKFFEFGKFDAEI